MKIVAHYKNEQLQTKGWKALARYKPKRIIRDGLPMLVIERLKSDNDVVNNIVKELKKTSKPFLIAKYNNDSQKDAGTYAGETMNESEL